MVSCVPGSLSDDERSVLLSELLLRHPELVAKAREITSTLLLVDDDQELADEVTARLRALRSGQVSVDAGQRRVLGVLQPYIDDLTRRRNAVPGGPPISRSLSCSGCNDCHWLANAE